MRLIAKITHEELFQKWTHELGTILYTVDDQGVVNKAVYHSSSRTVFLSPSNGVSEQMAKRIKAEGFLVNRLEIDEVQGYVKIIQGSVE